MNRKRGRGKDMKRLNVMSWKFWFWLLIGALLIAAILPSVLEGQEASKQETATFTDAERMSVKDKQVEYWRLQAQAASILLQAANLQAELNSEVMRLQARCTQDGGRYDPGTVSCSEVQAQEGK